VARKASAPPGGTGGDVYTMAEAASLKGVSYHTVSRAVRSGRLPARRLGRMAFVAAPDLAAWRPMVQRAPKKYRRSPDAGAAPALVDLASGDRVALAQRFASLVETIQLAAIGGPLDRFLAVLCEHLAAALGLRRVALWGVDERAGVVRRLASFGPPMSTLPDSVPLAAAADFASFVARDAAVTGAVGELGRVPVIDGAPAALLGVGSLFAAPLRVGDRVVGAVMGDRDGVPFDLDPAQLAFARALANQAALAMEVASLRARC
jgi:excisionase family DNA binding protein